MRHRFFTLLTFLALVLAACAGEGAGETTTTAPDPTTTTTAPAMEAMQLSYALEPGASYTYEVTLDQVIDMTTSGDTEALGDGEEVPGEMSLTVNGTSTFTHTVAEGPEPGTFEINIVGDFSDLEFGGTVDGEPVEEGEIPDLAEMEPVDVTIVVDEQGNVIPEDNADLGSDLLGGMGGGLDMLNQFGAAAGTGQFVGPPLADEAVTVGDTWSETIEVPTMPGSDPIVTELQSEVTGTETVDGVEVLVIDTTTTTSPVEFDLAEMLIGFMTAFVPEDATEEERAQLETLAEQLRFAFSIDESVSEMTSLFDPEAGLARQSEVTGDTHMVMDINIPDESTGELVAFEMDMTVSQQVTYRLVDSSDA